MESNVLATVLTSSVVAGVISSLVAYFQFHKNNVGVMDNSVFN